MKNKKSYTVIHEIDEATLIVYHSLTNQPHLVEFEDKIDKLEFINSLGSHLVQTGNESLDFILSLSDQAARDLLANKKQEYATNTKNRVNFLSLMTAESCNLGCSYCIATTNMDDAKKNKSTMMSWYVAKKGLDWYFSLSKPFGEYYVNFSGGEPLLNRKIVTKAIEYIRATHHNKPVKITINTNATLVDDSLAQFFAANKVSIATSLDGTPDVSDNIRVTKKGLPASRDIIQGWEKLKAAGCDLTGFMSTFNDKNIDYLQIDIIDFALSMGFSWVRIACDVIHLLQYSVDKAVDQIWEVYKYGKEKGVLVEGFWSTPIHNMLYRERISEDASFFCGAVSGETVSVHPDGRMSACGFSSGSFGNVLLYEPFDWGKHKKFVEEYYPGSREFCQGCSIEGSCAGGCNITREVSIAENDETAILYNCEMYRKLTKLLLMDHFSDDLSGFSNRSPSAYIY